MLFNDRQDAGNKLATKLATFANNPKTLIIGLPRGGVVTAAAVAQKLHLPLDIVCPRKIGAPGNPEFAIGAVTESGDAFFDERVIAFLGAEREFLQRAIHQEHAEAQRRLRVYRQGRPTREYSGWTVILVDDGIATGATMKAAIKTVKARGAAKVIVAVPVISPDAVNPIAALVDAIFYVQAPADFAAVGQFYAHFESTSDDNVIRLLAN